MDTDFLDQWAVKIAREAAPDEIYQAAFVAIAFARGGKERKKLFRQPEGGEAGGFGLAGIEQVILPYIFQALVASGPLIYKLLSDGAINNGIDLAKFLQEAYAFLKKKRAHQAAQGQAGTSPVAPSLPSLSPLSASTVLASSTSVPASSEWVLTDVQAEQLRATIRTQIEELLKNMLKQMAPSGIDSENLEDKSYHTLVVLFKEPEEAKKFIDLLGKRK